MLVASCSETLWVQSYDFYIEQLAYAIYFVNGRLYLYEYGNKRVIGTKYYERGEEYEIRIELKRQSGARYYYRKKGDTEWNILSNSTYGISPSFRVGFCAYAGTFAVDDMKVIHHAYGPVITAPIFQDQTVTLTVADNAGQEDTDNDGLCDGLDASGIGELSLGTNPLNEDSDYDLLKDSTEVFGWNTTINFFEGSKVLHVSSEPLSYDTDFDGVSDYDEFQAGSNPRLKDSDGDGLEDLLDPFPTNFDKDGDYLSDKIELDIGTGLNNTDSDVCSS